MQKLSKGIIVSLIIGIIYYLILYYLSFGLIKLAINNLPDESYNLLIITKPISYLIMIILALITYKFVKSRVTQDIVKVNLKGILLIILLAILLRIFTDFIINFEYIFYNKGFSYTQRRIPIDIKFWSNTISSIILVPILEELVFRGLIFKILKSHVSLIISIIISSLLFAVGHINPLEINYGLFLKAFILGVVLAIIYTKYRLGGVILLHGCYNLIILIAGMYYYNYISLIESIGFDWKYWTLIIVSVAGVIYILKQINLSGFNKMVNGGK